VLLEGELCRFGMTEDREGRHDFQPRPLRRRARQSKSQVLLFVTVFDAKS
jgi:hypothetical protein